MGILGRFRKDQRGATAMLFGLSVLPLIGAVGAAVDYGRAANEHAKLQRATDATVLALVREPKTLSPSRLQERAKAVFDSLYAPVPSVAVADPEISRDGDALTLSRRGTMTNAFIQVLGLRSTAIGATASAVWGTQRIELALVLDNTGSMDDKVGSKRKIDALKRSANDLVEKLRGLATESDLVRVSVVPFNTEVRVNPSDYRNKDWIRWDDPDSRTERLLWRGYIVDRHQPNDASDVAPDPLNRDTLYTKRRTTEYGRDLAFVQPLASLDRHEAYEAVKRTIKDMEPTGNTNVGLGVSWGLGTLTGSIPLEGPASSRSNAVKRFMVVLTDGDNTQNWVDGKRNAANDGRVLDKKVVAGINERTTRACDKAKEKSVEIFTIRLLAGDVGLLKGCASSTDHYFNVEAEGELDKAFGEILAAISRTRIAS